MARWIDGVAARIKELETRATAAERHRDMLQHLLDEANAHHFDATMRADSLADENARLREFENAVRQMTPAAIRYAGLVPFVERMAKSGVPSGSREPVSENEGGT